MVTTILGVLMGLTALAIMCSAAVYLGIVYRYRRILRSSRFRSIKTLYGLHFQRQAFLIADKQ